MEFVIFLFGRKWEIKLVQPHDPLLWVNNTARIGCTWPMTRQIAISNELNDDNFEDVLAHELVHAVISETAFSDPKEYDEEHLANFYQNFHRLLEKTLNDAMDLYKCAKQPLSFEESEHFRGC